MKILFLTPQIPYPAVSGGLIKTLKMIEHLSDLHDLTVGFFEKEGGDLVGFQSGHSKVKTFSIPLQIERSPLTFFQSILHGVPMSLYRNSSQVFQDLCHKEMQKADVIVVDHFLMFQYIPHGLKKKVVFHTHNAEYLMWQRFAETQSNPLKKAVLLFESWRIKKAEADMIERASVVLASPNDILELKKISTKNIHFMETYHLGEDYLLNEPQLIFERSDRSMLYIGTLTWEANREGLYRFLKETWPLVKIKEPGVVFTIIGKDNNPTLFSHWREDSQIKWLGFVDDLRPYYERARVFVSPLNFGSGIKVKVVNALYRGLPTVTTSIGVEGLQLKDKEDIFVADTPEDQARAISICLNEKNKWEKISYNSRKIALEKYSWASVLKTISEAVEL